MFTNLLSDYNMACPVDFSIYIYIERERMEMRHWIPISSIFLLQFNTNPNTILLHWIIERLEIPVCNLKLGLLFLSDMILMWS